MSVFWHEILVEVVRDEAESWADACLDAGALSVQAEDADADSPDEQAQFGEPNPDTSGPTAGVVVAAATAATAAPVFFGWRRTRLAVLLDGATDPQSLLDGVAAALGRPAPRIAAVNIVQDRDWVRATQAQFEPIEVGDRLLIVPSWHLEQVRQRANERVTLIIDPGLAFGTGSHPTTRMCLEWLDQADLVGRRVIDYGCGSGILAIAAARLGAATVIGLDIDPQALTSARENALSNDVTISVQSSSEAMPAPANVVIANILSNPLKLLAPVLAALVAPGGTLVLSGVLERQIDEVAAFYDSSVPVSLWRAQDGWACLAGTRAPQTF